jgi:acyl carrier protein
MKTIEKPIIDERSVDELVRYHSSNMPDIQKSYVHQCIIALSKVLGDYAKPEDLTSILMGTQNLEIDSLEEIEMCMAIEDELDENIIRNPIYDAAAEGIRTSDYHKVIKTIAFELQNQAREQTKHNFLF